MGVHRRSPRRPGVPPAATSRRPDGEDQTMSRLHLPAIFLLMICPSATWAGSNDLGPADRAILAGYARDTWQSFAAMAMPSGLPCDSLTLADGRWTPSTYTSPSNIGAYLWSILAAEDLEVIGHDEAAQRIGKTLETLGRIERAHGFYLNWYDPKDGSTVTTWPGGGPIRPFLSTVDNGWLAASLVMIRNARPAFRDIADGLLGPMNFGFFYDPYDASNPAAHPGLLRGGYWLDDKTFAGFHYGMLNTEARIASYIGISRGDLPLDHYYRMSRSRPPAAESRSDRDRFEVQNYHGVPVEQGFRTVKGLRVVPSWDGSMFEALMVSLFIPEAEWAPHAWGINHPLYVRAQIQNALEDARMAAWGVSASNIPGGGYRVFGVAGLSADGRRTDTVGDTVVTPHASFLALAFAPREAMANMSILSEKFRAYGPHGFHDAVDVASGKVSETSLAIDQGMIMAAIANALTDGGMQRAFCEGDIDRVIRPLIAPERFASGIEEGHPNRPSSRSQWRLDPPAPQTVSAMKAPAEAEPAKPAPMPAPAEALVQQ
ncbi:glucoamylase family protein [Tundrisphaera sp. TA3]|uniref:glucoamylase family protein n=1 Tax=Tundrisphaera sp. TA3 TaxID=3435775 RepID=UPI003EB7052E